MLKLLITGATGFVGRYVVTQALQKGYDIHLIVRNYQKAIALFGKEIKTYQIDDLTQKTQLAKIIENISPQYVINLIGIIKEIKSQTVTFEKVHYEYSKCLFEVLKDYSAVKVIHMSALGVDEKAPSRYHKTKLMAEKELIKSGIPFVIIRPSFIIGPEQLLFVKLKSILKKTPVLLFPDIHNYFFQPVDVRDVATCFLNAIEHEENEIFELCGDQKVSLKDMVKDFIKTVGGKVLFIAIPGLFLKLFATEQYKMMWKDNICGHSIDALSMQKILGRQPIPYKEQIKWAAKF